MAYDVTERESPWRVFLQGITGVRESVLDRRRQQMLDELRARLQQAEEDRQGRTAEAQIANWETQNQANRLAVENYQVPAETDFFKQLSSQGAQQAGRYGLYYGMPQAKFREVMPQVYAPSPVPFASGTLQGMTGTGRQGEGMGLPSGPGFNVTPPPPRFETVPEAKTESVQDIAFRNLQRTIDQDTNTEYTKVVNSDVALSNPAMVNARIDSWNESRRRVFLPDLARLPEGIKAGPVTTARVGLMGAQAKEALARSKYWDEKTDLLHDEFELRKQQVEGQIEANRKRTGQAAANAAATQSRFAAGLAYRARKDALDFVRMWGTNTRQAYDQAVARIVDLDKLRRANHYTDASGKIQFIDKDIETDAKAQVTVLTNTVNSMKLPNETAPLMSPSPGTTINIGDVTRFLGGGQGTGGGTVTVPPPRTVDTSEVTTGLQNYAKTDAPGQGRRRTKQTIDFLVSKGLSPGAARTKATELMGGYYWKPYQARRKAKK